MAASMLLWLLSIHHDDCRSVTDAFSFQNLPVRKSSFNEGSTGNHRHLRLSFPLKQTRGGGRKADEPSILLHLQIKDETTTTTVTSNNSIQKYYHIGIEYCIGCRWMLKSFWLAQEVLSTFSKQNELYAISVIPSTRKGIFTVSLKEITADGSEEKKNGILLWDRTENGGFPSPKELKQTVRDCIDPDKFLGHSDTKERQTKQEDESGSAAAAAATTIIDTSVTTATTTTTMSADSIGIPPAPHSEYTPSPSVSIHYCTGCQWLLRAAYLGQEILTTFDGGEIKSITLVPSRPPDKGGRFVSTNTCTSSSSSSSYTVCVLDRYRVLTLYPLPSSPSN
jgi:selenoprotein W-related protein